MSAIGGVLADVTEGATSGTGDDVLTDVSDSVASGTAIGASDAISPVPHPPTIAAPSATPPAASTERSRPTLISIASSDRRRQSPSAPERGATASPAGPFDRAGGPTRALTDVARSSIDGCVVDRRPGAGSSGGAHDARSRVAEWGSNPRPEDDAATTGPSCQTALPEHLFSKLTGAVPRGQVGDPLCRGRPSTFDEVATWQVEDPVVVATRSGDRARDATAHKGDRVWIVFVVADGSSTMTATLLAPESTWVTLRDDVEEMAASIALPEEAP